MNKVMHIGFNTNDINKAIAKLTKLDADLKTLPDKLVQEIADDGLKHLDMLYGATQFDENSGDIHTSVKKTALGYAIVASGKDVIYEEFGTGEVGKENPHPEKSEYPLNDYNSGDFVSTHINENGRHYWFYNGKYYEGIASGKQIFNTRNYILNDGIKKAKDKLVGDMLSKL